MAAPRAEMLCLGEGGGGGYNGAINGGSPVFSVF